LKIGILTFHWARKFGALLQAWSLYKLLTGIGYKVKIINFQPVPLVISHLKLSELVIKRYIPREQSLVQTLLQALGAQINTLLIRNEIKERKIISNFFEEAFGESLLKEKIITNLGELKQECLKYDICLVGSDQVWNPNYLRLSDFAYLLPFKLRKTKKVAFSASIAVDISSITEDIIKLYKITLPDFSFISVREKSHKDWLSSLIKRKVHHTLDPTLLLDKKTFEKLSKETSIPHDQYVLIYNIHYSSLPLAERIVETLQLPAIIYEKLPLFPLKRRTFISRRLKLLKNSPSFLSLGPREFIYLLKNAEFVVTDSFHGTALSIIFQKNFVSIITEVTALTGSRISELLKDLQLNDRILTINDIIDKNKLKTLLRKDIDYSNVNTILKNLRYRSLELLCQALKNSDS
jgi:hypothetical protein